jgi:hypothetical protein
MMFIRAHKTWNIGHPAYPFERAEIQALTEIIFTNVGMGTIHKPIEEMLFWVTWLCPLPKITFVMRSIFNPNIFRHVRNPEERLLHSLKQCVPPFLRLRQF